MAPAPTDPTPSAATPASSRATRLWPPLALAWLFALPFALQPVSETDAGWHLALGRLVATRGIPFENALAWTHPREPWYATTWLFDLLCYEVTTHAGILGLQLVTFAFLAGTLAFVALAARRIDPLGGWLAPVVALLLVPRITERPDVASWLVLAAVLWLGLAGTRRARGLAVALIAVGSNFHTGVVFGTGLLGLFCIDAWGKERAAGRSGWAEVALAAASVLALAANPGGLFDARYLLENLHAHSVVPVGELVSPSLLRAPTFYATLALALAGSWRMRRQRPVLLAATVVFGALGVYALRLVYDFEIVAAAPLAAGLCWLRERGSARRVGGALALMVAVTLAARARFFERLQLGARFDAHALPVRAARYIRAAGLAGPFFNAYRDGGYLEWALPELPAFQDGRVQAFPPAFFAAEEKADRSPQAFRAYVRGLGVEWAIASRTPEPLAGYRRFDGPDWALVYWDDASEVWLRRDVPRLAGLVARDEYRCLRPYGSVLGRLRNLTRGQLRACVREADRLAATDNDDPLVAIVRCGALVRLGAQDHLVACRLARALAENPAEHALVTQAQALPLSSE